MKTLQVVVPVANCLAEDGFPTQFLDEAHAAAQRRLDPDQRIVGRPKWRELRDPVDFGSCVISRADGITCFELSYAVETDGAGA